jgi:hypothetical protein
MIFAYMSWICPKCERELKKLNQMHYCIKVSLDDLLKGQSEELVLAVDKLLAEIADWDGVTISCSKNYIVFVRQSNLLFNKADERYAGPQVLFIQITRRLHCHEKHTVFKEV